MHVSTHHVSANAVPITAMDPILIDSMENSPNGGPSLKGTVKHIRVGRKPVSLTDFPGEAKLILPELTPCG